MRRALLLVALLAACGGRTDRETLADAGTPADSGSASESGISLDGSTIDAGGAPDSAAVIGPCGSGAGVTTLTTGPGGAGLIAVDADNVYWTNNFGCTEGPCEPSGEILQCSKCGCTSPTVLADDPAELGPIGVDGTGVYFIAATGELMNVPIGGGPITTLAANVVSFVLGANAVYFDEGGAIQSTPRGGGPTSTILTGLSSPVVFAVDDTHLVWAESMPWSLHVAALDGSGATTLAVLAANDTPSAVALDADHVYWTNFNDDQPGATLVKVAIGGGSPTILASGLQAPYAIALDATTVYWTSDDAVMSVRKAGGATATLAQHDPYLAPFGVAVDATSVYWSDSITGAVVRLTPK